MKVAADHVHISIWGEIPPPPPLDDSPVLSKTMHVVNHQLACTYTYYFIDCTINFEH